MMVMSDSDKPMVATASAPSRATQNTSTTAKRDSSNISSTIGMASRKMARSRLPAVKSCCEPWIASRTEAQKVGVFRVVEATSIEDKEVSKIPIKDYRRE